MTMSRIIDGTTDTMTQFFAESSRTFQVNAEAAADANRDPADRCDRVEVCAGTILRVYDDVAIKWVDAPLPPIPRRIICGSAGDRTNFCTYRFDPTNGGFVTETFDASLVLDVAPVDPSTVITYDENGVAIIAIPSP